MMKKGLVTMILALTMAMVSSVAFAAQVVELNETYMLEQTRTLSTHILPKLRKMQGFIRPCTVEKTRTITRVLIRQSIRGNGCL